MTTPTPLQSLGRVQVEDLERDRVQEYSEGSPRDQGAAGSTRTEALYLGRYRAFCINLICTPLPAALSSSAFPCSPLSCSSSPTTSASFTHNSFSSSATLPLSPPSCFVNWITFSCSPPNCLSAPLPSLPFPPTPSQAPPPVRDGDGRGTSRCKPRMGRGALGGCVG